MNRCVLAVVFFSAAISWQAMAANDQADDAKYLNRVESAVFETTGDHQSVAKHGATCIAQIIKPGVVNAPTIISSDFDSGVIVANNNFKFVWHGFLGTAIEDTGRTTLTFEAKDGRGRSVQTSREQFITCPGQYAALNQGWTPVPAETIGADMKKALDELFIT